MSKLFPKSEELGISLSKGVKFVLAFPFLYSFAMLFIFGILGFLNAKFDYNQKVGVIKGSYLFFIYLLSILLFPFIIFYNYLSSTHLVVIFIVGFVLVFFEGLVILGLYKILYRIFDRKAIYILTAIIILLMLLVALLPRWGNYRMEKEGNKIIAKVEEFKKNNGRLPNSRSEMGHPDSESIKPQYIKVNESDYEIFYPIGFDDGYVYYSKTKKWGDYPPAVAR
jgi:hypothetical protein